MPQMSSQTSFTPSDQAARIIPLAPQSNGKAEAAPFRNNRDHLEALEREARLLLGHALLRRAGAEWRKDAELRQALSYLQMPDEEIIAERLEKLLALEMQKNRAREEVSLGSGIELFFCRLGLDYGLEAFDQAAVLLLFMLRTSRSFLDMYLQSGFERKESVRGGMKIGALLSIFCKDYREQLERRSRFRVDAPLVHHEIISMDDCSDDEANILDERVQLSGRFERYLLDDDSLYSSDFRLIRRERTKVRLEQVIMPEERKTEIIAHVNNYLKHREQGSEASSLDDFFGYGTALTFLFHGPSGTGKTMLAHGLANHFERHLLSLKEEDMDEIPRSDNEILAILFREASLRKGIVLLDESDDLFRASSRASRSLLIEIEKARCIIILATNQPVELDPALERRIAMKVHFPLPDAILRCRIWQALLPECVQLAPDVSLDEIAERFPFTGGLIKNTFFMAVNRASGTSTTGALLLTRADLEQAAELQALSLAETTGLGRSYLPTRTLGGLPLRRRQKEELGNTARAYHRLRQEGLGLNILLCCSDVPTGVHTAEALAAICGLRVREFDCGRVMSIADEDRMVDPLTHKRVKPLTHAFSPGTGGTCLTLFIDHEGTVLKSLDEDGHSGNRLFLSDLLGHLREHRGFFCLVTRSVKPGYLPSLFHLRFDLEYPPEEDQIRRWELHLGKGAGTGEILVSLVEEHPMHLGEIDFIARQATTHSIIQGRDGRPTMADIRQAIARHGCRAAPVLFGARPKVW